MDTIIECIPFYTGVKRDWSIRHPIIASPECVSIELLLLCGVSPTTQLSLSAGLKAQTKECNPYSHVDMLIATGEGGGCYWRM